MIIYSVSDTQNFVIVEYYIQLFLSLYSSSLTLSTHCLKMLEFYISACVGTCRDRSACAYAMYDLNTTYELTHVEIDFMIQMIIMHAAFVTNWQNHPSPHTPF